MTDEDTEYITAKDYAELLGLPRDATFAERVKRAAEVERELALKELS